MTPGFQICWPYMNPQQALIQKKELRKEKKSYEAAKKKKDLARIVLNTSFSEFAFSK
jgi:hypothetical protein